MMDSGEALLERDGWFLLILGGILFVVGIVASYFAADVDTADISEPARFRVVLGLGVAIAGVALGLVGLRARRALAEHKARQKNRAHLTSALRAIAGERSSSATQLRHHLASKLAEIGPSGDKFTSFELLGLSATPLASESTEVRWFVDAPSPALKQWFESCEPESRVDIYCLPGNEGVGVKLREGRIEVKTRLDGNAELKNAAGRIEHWRKWSHPLETPLPQEVELGTAWIAVHKTRRIIRYADDGTCATPLEGHGQARGAFELTELRTRHGSSWTFAIEAFEAGAKGEGVVRRIFADVERHLVPLESIQSSGYPAWLGVHS